MEYGMGFRNIPLTKNFCPNVNEIHHPETRNEKNQTGMNFFSMTHTLSDTWPIVLMGTSVATVKTDVCQKKIELWAR